MKLEIVRTPGFSRTGEVSRQRAEAHLHRELAQDVEVRLQLIADGAGRQVLYGVVKGFRDASLVPREIVAGVWGLRRLAEVLGDALDEAMGFLVGRGGALLARRRGLRVGARHDERSVVSSACLRRWALSVPMVRLSFCVR